MRDSDRIELFDPERVAPFAWEGASLNVNQLHTYLEAACLASVIRNPDQVVPYLQAGERSSVPVIDIPTTSAERARLVVALREYLLAVADPLVKLGEGPRLGNVVRVQLAIPQEGVLFIEGSPEHTNHSLPWEFLSMADAGAPFAPLAVLRSTGDSRLEKTPPRPKVSLRALGVAISPQLNESWLRFNPIHELRASLYRPLAPLRPHDGLAPAFVSDAREPIDLRALMSHIEERNPSAIHVVAHGRGSTILMVGPNGEPVAVTGAQFGRALRAAKDLRIVSLATCGSAAAAPRLGGMTNFAEDLAAAAGVGIVVASRFVLPVQTARVFFATFYRNLLHGNTVEFAVSRARAVVAGAGDLSYGGMSLYVDTPEIAQTTFVLPNGMSSGWSEFPDPTPPWLVGAHSESAEWDELRRHICGLGDEQRRVELRRVLDNLGRELGHMGFHWPKDVADRMARVATSLELPMPVAFGPVLARTLRRSVSSKAEIGTYEAILALDICECFEASLYEARARGLVGSDISRVDWLQLLRR